LVRCRLIEGSTAFKEEVEKDIQSEIKSLHRGDYLGIEPLLEGRTGGVAVHHTTAVSVGTSELLFVSYQRMRSHLHGFHNSTEMIRAGHSYPLDASLRGDADFEDDWTTFKERLTKPLYKKQDPLRGKSMRFGTNKGDTITRVNGRAGELH